MITHNVPNNAFISFLSQIFLLLVKNLLYLIITVTKKVNLSIICSSISSVLSLNISFLKKILRICQFFN